MQNNVYEEKRHFNIIDFMIIIGAILVIVGIIFRAQIIDFFNASGKQTTYTVTFEADEVPLGIADTVANGSSVIWLEKSIQLGTLSNMTKAPATVYLPESDGTFKAVSSSDLVKITGSFTALGKSNNGCYINGTDFLAAGMTVTLATPTSQIEVIITSINGQ